MNATSQSAGTLAVGVGVVGVVGVVGLLALVLTACGRANMSAQPAQTVGIAAKAGPPPIDLEAPDHYETATFALG